MQQIAKTDFDGCVFEIMNQSPDELWADGLTKCLADQSQGEIEELDTNSWWNNGTEMNKNTNHMLIIGPESDHCLPLSLIPSLHDI